LNFKLEGQIIKAVVSVNGQAIVLQTENILHSTAQLLLDVVQHKCNTEISFKKFQVMAFKISSIPHEFKNGGKLPDHG
jgi:hypothetical protein